MTFAELALAEPILRALASEGYAHPTPIQAQAIPHALAGKDVLGSAQTGTGKTAAFSLPILHRLALERTKHPNQHQHRHLRALILSPTRELALQIDESLRTYGRHTHLRSVCIFGGVGQNPQVRALRQGVDIAVATPGRLEDLMQQGHVNLSHVEVFVLDEADRMLDMGFIEPIRRVASRLPAARQTLMFSATMPKPIRHLADALLREPVSVQVAAVAATPDRVKQTVIMVPKAHKPRTLVDLLSGTYIERALVFSRTKHGADRIARGLSEHGIPAEAIHGDKRQNVRQRALASFREGRIIVLVATDIAARGIDVDGVSHVINYDIPHEPETYVHRIGRTARAGTSGQAISLCDPTSDERGFLRDIERLIRRPIDVLHQAGGTREGEARPAPDRPAAARREHTYSAQAAPRPRQPHHRERASEQRPRQRTDRPPAKGEQRWTERDAPRGAHPAKPAGTPGERGPGTYANGQGSRDQRRPRGPGEGRPAKAFKPATPGGKPSGKPSGKPASTHRKGPGKRFGPKG